jgi:hypothetical protein
MSGPSREYLWPQPTTCRPDQHAQRAALWFRSRRCRFVCRTSSVKHSRDILLGPPRAVVIVDDHRGWRRSDCRAAPGIAARLRNERRPGADPAFLRFSTAGHKPKPRAQMTRPLRSPTRAAGLWFRGLLQPSPDEPHGLAANRRRSAGRSPIDEPLELGRQSRQRSAFHNTIPSEKWPLRAH